MNIMTNNEIEEEKIFSPRILIFDKKSDDSFLLAHYLRYCTFDVFTECVVDNFIEKIQDIKPDFVVISESFYPVTGYELCTMLRQQGELDGIFIILLLEEDTESSQIRAKISGADETVTRPKISDKSYSHHKIAKFVHTHLINKPNKLA